MRVLFLVIALCLPLVVFSQSDEKLFCANCGVKNALTSNYCYQCGERLDKSALIDRLKTRISVANSARQMITMSTDEISVLVEAEVDTKIADRLHRHGVTMRSLPKTSTDQTLDIIAPIVTALAAVWLLSKALF